MPRRRRRCRPPPCSLATARSPRSRSWKRASWAARSSGPSRGCAPSIGHASCSAVWKGSATKKSPGRWTCSWAPCKRISTGPATNCGAISRTAERETRATVMSLCRSSAATLLAAVIPGCLSSQAAPDTSGAPPRDTAGVAPLTSETVIRGDLLRALPVDDSRQALILAPAVVLRGGDIGIGVAPVIAIRGSRLGAAAVYVDGAPVRFQAFGTQAMAPGTFGIDRISVTTGVPAASVLDAGGGVISYVTAAGGQRLTGIWRTETDEPFGDGSTVGYNRFEGWVGGPVPGVARLTWAASGTLYGQRSQYYGPGAADQPAYVLGGLDTLVQSTDASGSTVTVPPPRFVQWSGSCSAADHAGLDCQGLRR